MAQIQQGPEKEVRVLIVDGDGAIQTVLSNLFQKRGCLVTSVGTGAEALEQVNQNRFHFAVIDTHLPDMSGVDLFDQIHKNNFKINCIMVTGRSEKDSETSFGQGTVASGIKPFKLDQLIATFEKKAA